MESLLDVKQLTKKFGAFTAVNGISFSVKKGEILGLLGPNGAGKTTTIAMILGIITPSSGTIRIFGKEFEPNRQEILGRMNYSSAYSKLSWRLKVWEALSVFAELYGVERPEERIDTLLKAFGVEKLRDKLLGDLSAGNSTRVNLCKAFINRPELVLLDEPTASLDPEIADSVRQFIRVSRDKFRTTILITSHNMNEIEELCDRVIFQNSGRMVDEDTPEGLAKKISRTRVKLMMRDGQKRTLEYCRKHGLSAESAERHVVITVEEAGIAKLLNNLAELKVDYADITIEKPTLEDYFVREVRRVA